MITVQVSPGLSCLKGPGYTLQVFSHPLHMACPNESSASEGHIRECQTSRRKVLMDTQNTLVFLQLFFSLLLP